MAKNDTAPRRLTDVFVRQRKPDPSRRIEIRDSLLTGLILRVTPKGAKSFALHTRGPDGKTMHLTLGRYPGVSLDAARKISKEYLQSIARGEDPRVAIRRAKAVAEAQSLTLRLLLGEAQERFAPTKVVWREDGRPGRKKPEARSAIENIFSSILDKPLDRLTVSDVSRAVKTYKPLRPKSRKGTANGAVSRALSYLKAVFNWAACRGRFAMEGAGRDPKVDVVDVATVYDPSLDDPTIEGVRERLLNQKELERVLPLLVYPAPPGLRANLDPRKDYGPIAMKFQFLTVARLDEVCSAQRKEFDLIAKTWTRKVKTRRNPGSKQAGQPRIVTMPLSQEAVALLRSLPSFNEAEPEDRVFPSAEGGRLWNWNRLQTRLFAMSQTSGWTRHDLRRTGATILNQLGVAPSVIDGLLSHENHLANANVSGSAVTYILESLVLDDEPDPSRHAVEVLAKALRQIEGSVSTHCVSSDLKKPAISSRRFEHGEESGKLVSDIHETRESVPMQKTPFSSRTWGEHLAWTTATASETGGPRRAARDLWARVAATAPTMGFTVDASLSPTGRPRREPARPRRWT